MRGHHAGVCHFDVNTVNTSLQDPRKYLQPCIQALVQKHA